jgi:hypothetical protein
LEPVGEQVEQAAAGTSKSAISRHFVKATETALAELLARGPDDLDLVASMLPARSPRQGARGIHPGAAASLREGLSETLTVLRSGVPPTVTRTLRSTDSIESMISIACPSPPAQRQALAGRNMALRWCAAGMTEASRQFRRVNGTCTSPSAAPSRSTSPPKQAARYVRMNQ